MLIFPKSCLRIALQFTNLHTSPFTIWHLGVPQCYQLQHPSVLARWWNFHSLWIRHISISTRPMPKLIVYNLKQAHQWHQLAVDKKKHGETLSLGDQVWLYTPAVKEGRSTKLAASGMVPTVVNKTSSVNYHIQRIKIGTAHHTVVHRNRLKPTFGVP